MSVNVYIEKIDDIYWINTTSHEVLWVGACIFMYLKLLLTEGKLINEWISPRRN